MYCESCGNQIAQTSQFCSHCGARNLKAVSSAVIDVEGTVISSEKENSTVVLNPVQNDENVSQGNSQYNQQSSTPYVQQSNATYAQSSSTQSSSCSQQSNYQNAQYVQQPIYTQNCTVNANGVVFSRTGSDKTLLLVAFVLNVLSCFVWAVTIIGLAWAIPMTVHSYGIYKGKKPNTIAFGICTLLFMDIIGGVLMLIAQKDD